MSRAQPPADAAMEAAIDWMVALRAGPVDAQLQADFDAWRNASAQHLAAWQRLERGLAAPLQAVRQWDQASANANANAAGHSLRRQLEQPSKRVTLRALGALGLGLGGAAWMSDRFVPLRYLSADWYSGTGQRVTTTLADGSQLLLNARSAANVYPDRQPPQIDLLQGDLYWQAAAQNRQLSKQWCISTRDARCYSQGALSVRQQDDGSLFHASLGTARLQLAQSSTLSEPFALQQGQTALVQAGQIRLAPQWDAALTSWQQGILLAAPLSLAEVVQQLQRYSPGLLQVSSRAGALQVHARLPLDDVPRALLALEETLPIHIRRLGSVAARIELA